jgi:hypothetical protein
LGGCPLAKRVGGWDWELANDILLNDLAPNHTFV